ncbi:putative PurR-regulated permease PerM [Janthinobacterium sp. CG_S6]|nr:putative PurR-regulated permease PerM [Janthinobacterium sp. CG_S6]
MNVQPTQVQPDLAAVVEPADACPATPAAAAPVQQTDTPELQNAPLRLPLHVNARGLALAVIATVTFVWGLQWAQKFLIPLLLGIFIAYTLNPLVRWLERIKIPRALGTTLVTVMILGGSVAVIDRVQGEFEAIVEELPASAGKISGLIEGMVGGKPGMLQKIQAVATQIERAANGAEARRAARRAEPAPDHPQFKVFDWVWAGSMGLIGFLSQATMVIFLVFFLLLSGDTFKRKLVKLTGPSLTKKKITVHILEDINTSIQKYMFMLLITNGLLALLMWIALSLIGLENAGAWAVVAGLLHIMPYFGPLLITVATAMIAFLQFESLEMVALVAGTSLAIATVVGTFVATWMTGKIARMNPTAVFVSLLFWGWLWGVWGLLLGVPVIVIVKVVAERVQGMEAVAELLGE